MADTDKPIRILTVDDHPLLREGIAGVISGENDMQLVGEACTGHEAIAAFRAYLPDVTLMDLQMPELNGVDAIVQIRDEFPAARIIVLTTYSGDVQALRALRAGAQGYLLKSSLRKELLDTIRAVVAGRRRIPPEIAAEIAEHVTDRDLTTREIEILKGVAAGNSNKRIAAQLSISEETVKTHVKSVLSKLDAHDRTHAVTIAIRRGIIAP
ncbi:LuxR family transcriptional regulator [Lysobacter daejeonensis GH1-9]|uniref:LuxR family transcriptional regulator n=1 Tax=Lysobacter daejeonensis GH1-9 TaxID=1385517 RepID=A0A0A0EZ58_9GAMM|nr:response regulator transcription factor [Lysobacter daejeonensis]KGM56241.1 LuxR family transcriptional regulator [Lysobacter daejeonensis GH1-9]